MTVPSTRVYVDVETTGLDPRLHHVTEVSWAVEGGKIQTWHPPHSLQHADPAALAIQSYYQRQIPERAILGADLRPVIARALTGATFVAANAAFDAAFLTRLLGFAPWRFRLLDIEAYGMAVLGLPEVPSLRDLADQLATRGVVIGAPDHTAPADVACLRAVHQALEVLAARNAAAPPASEPIEAAP